uniref:RING-type domain-containing protein n=1 Tax=Globisporangium ultimum (strain ATCC 200006 / CBS 805.95 / DAOM BR144) TaxID=431595 RepID=K3WVZ9_GLOUD
MNQVTCLVCYNGQVDVMLEPCQHQFHAQCIDRWLNKDKVCPICWTPIQNQRRIMPPAQYAHHPQAATGPPGGLPPNVPRGNYGANMNKSMVGDNGVSGGPVNMNMTPTNGAPLGNDGSGGLAGVATMNANELPNPATMRKGKWTAEESSYCDRLIEEFKKGNLPLAEGTTLRTFLSKLLNCDPMRISKKYTGDQCIGKIIFRRREDEVSKEDMELIRRDLAELEKTYLEREQYNQRRREKRLESELSRDKSRYIAARTLGYNNTPSGANAGGGPAGAGGRPQMPVPVAPVAHYAQQPQGSKDVSIAQAPGHHHPQFPPTRGPMPVQHQAAANVHPPRYPVHNQHPHPQQQPMQSSASHLFNSSMQGGPSSSSGGGSHATDSTTSIMSMSNAGSSSAGNNDSCGSQQLEW